MLNKSNFAIAKLAAGEDDEMLPVYSGIWVEPGFTAVTNGTLAVRVSCYEADQSAMLFDLDGLEPAEHWTGFLLDKDSALKIATAIPSKSVMPQARFGLVDAITEDNPKATVAVNAVRRQAIVRSEKLPGTFPDLEKITPSKESARFTIRLSPELLVKLATTVQAFCKSREIDSIELRAYSGRKPMRIDAVCDQQELLALLMPMGEPEFGAPAVAATSGMVTARLKDIKKLPESARLMLRAFVTGGSKEEVRYMDVSEVREILALIKKQEASESDDVGGEDAGN